MNQKDAKIQAELVAACDAARDLLRDYIDRLERPKPAHVDCNYGRLVLAELERVLSAFE